jgi:hypothetical protein
MIDIIIFILFTNSFIRMATVPVEPKRVVNVSKACDKRAKTCRKRVLAKRRPFLPHEVKRRLKRGR